MATFKISEFKSNIDNMVRLNRFIVTFSQKAKNFLPTDVNTQYEYLIKSISTPTQQNPEILLNWFGLENKRVGDIVIPEISMTFLVDEKFNFRRGMEKWFATAHSPIENKRGLADYKADIELQIYKTDNKPISTKYIFKDIFPINVQQIPLSHTNTGSFEECTVVFSVDDFEIK